MEGNLLTLCTCCGSLIILDEKAFSSTSDSSSSRDYQTIENQKIEDLQNYKYYKELISYQNEDSKLPHFPLCQKCIDYFLRDEKTSNELFKKSIENFSQNKEIYNKCDSFMAEKSYHPHHSIKLKNPPKTQQTKILIKNIDVPIDDAKKDESKAISASFYAFSISHNGLYGTINNMRVGYLDNYPVPYEEIQNGLYLIARYLSINLKNQEINQHVFVLTSVITIYITNKPYELKFPTSKKDIKTFNMVLNKFMELFEILFESMSKKGIAAPHLIVSEKSTIGGFNYLYSKDNQYDFTNGMRKLLLDIKSVQVLRTFIP